MVLRPNLIFLLTIQKQSKIVRKEAYRKEDWKGNQVWEGYQYGLEFTQILEENRWKLNWLLGGRFEFEEISPSLSCQP